MIRILTDSAADLTPADRARPGVTVVPLQVVFSNGDTALDGVDITGDAFYERLKGEEKLPRTSQPSPDQFIEVFEQARAAGDQVVAVLLSSTLSGTWQCARLAAETCEFEDLWVVDSRTGSQGEAVLVREALRLRDEQGCTAEQIAAALEELKGRIRILGVVDSLKHLHKGGRLPAAVALVGGALGIKPVLSVMDGEIRLADTARGRPGALVALFKQIDKLGGIDPQYGYVLLYSDEKSTVAPIHRYLHDNLHLTGGRVAQLGAVIGTHIGPGCAALVFVAQPTE
ncbi:DegV family protein [uncultured Subdoligranulum sp.]|uniref:DegV family protein n=1 Tax=uncultured Subdoligranulum sp. TaxID=512298 RepID=UPI0025F8586E|nr:DegV family protein [uncultured Subdoligranulum sp.]